MNRIELLPIWTLSDGIPSAYDTTSGTYQEMVAKVYGAMRTLQLDYNSFANEVNEAITRFITDTNSDQEKFENEINKIVHDYIVMIDTKIAHQDRVIEENIAFVKNNLASEVTKVINEMKDSGELDIIIGDAIGGLGGRIETLESKVENQFIPTKTSDLQNDLNFASKDYVDTEIATFDFIKVVDELPAQGLENRFYFVPKADSETKDLFDEYAWINNKWEWITTKQIEVDLTPYYKKTEVYNKGEIDASLSTIIESGSNANGSWTKWSDGTMECTKVIQIDSAWIGTPWGSMYYYQDENVHYFAQEFISEPTDFQLFFNTTNSAGCWAGAYGTMLITKSSFKNFALFRPTENTVNGKLYVNAKGRWK